MTALHPGPPRRKITNYGCSTSAFAARCLHVVAELGVADHVGEDPVPTARLSASCGTDADALGRVLRLLTVHGVFVERDGGWAHTEASRLLRTDNPMSMAPFVRMLAAPGHWGGLTALEHSVRRGTPAFETVDPRGVWSYLRDHPDEAELFNSAMTAKAGGDIAAVLRAYDFSRFDTVADIGGGRGHLIRALLDATPGARGVLFDQPEVIGSLDVEHERLTTRPGDFFADPLPAADAYILMEVINDWADEPAAAIMSAIRSAATAGATLLFIEDIIDEQRPDPLALTVDVVMLAMTGGRVRTMDQLQVLFAKAGFEIARVIDTEGRVSIVEARAV